MLRACFVFKPPLPNFFKREDIQDAENQGVIKFQIGVYFSLAT